MSTIDDGGQQPGMMSLRDYFAGQAIQGACNHVPGRPMGMAASVDPSEYAQTAEQAYALADAMLAARQSPYAEMPSNLGWGQ